MAKKKLTALQKRRRKEAEKRNRIAYEKRGAMPKPTKQPEPPKQTAVKLSKEAFKRSAAETASLSKSALAADIAALWDTAYGKYKRLMQQGTPNAATVIYEQNFAGMNPYKNNMNTNRALAAKLKTWLKRKDVSATKAKKAQNKTLNYLKKHGFKDITKDELQQFFDLYQKYLEYTGGVPQGVRKYLEHFASAYEKYKEDPETNMQTIFENARERMYSEYETTFNASVFAENPLEF